jgi:hypothetical protein
VTAGAGGLAFPGIPNEGCEALGFHAPIHCSPRASFSLNYNNLRGRYLWNKTLFYSHPEAEIFLRLTGKSLLESREWAVRKRRLSREVLLE